MTEFAVIDVATGATVCRRCGPPAAGWSLSEPALPQTGGRRCICSSTDTNGRMAGAAPAHEA